MPLVRNGTNTCAPSYAFGVIALLFAFVGSVAHAQLNPMLQQGRQAAKQLNQWGASHNAFGPSVNPFTTFSNDLMTAGRLPQGAPGRMGRAAAVARNPFFSRPSGAFGSSAGAFPNAMRSASLRTWGAFPSVPGVSDGLSAIGGVGRNTAAAFGMNPFPGSSFLLGDTPPAFGFDTGAGLGSAASFPPDVFAVPSENPAGDVPFPMEGGMLSSLASRYAGGGAVAQIPFLKNAPQGFPASAFARGGMFLSASAGTLPVSMFGSVTGNYPAQDLTDLGEMSDMGQSLANRRFQSYTMPTGGFLSFSGVGGENMMANGFTSQQIPAQYGRDRLRVGRVGTPFGAALPYWLESLFGGMFRTLR
jgi:hypothetical protein